MIIAQGPVLLQEPTARQAEAVPRYTGYQTEKGGTGGKDGGLDTLHIEDGFSSAYHELATTNILHDTGGSFTLPYEAQLQGCLSYALQVPDSVPGTNKQSTSSLTSPLL